MELLNKFLNDNKEYLIYHVNANKVVLKKIFKGLDLKEKDVIFYHEQNPMNIDLFFFCKDVLKKDSKLFFETILFKTFYKDHNQLFTTFFHGVNFIKEFQKNFIKNKSLFITFRPENGGVFATSSMVFKPSISNTSVIQGYTFQIDLFAYDKDQEENERIFNYIQNQKKLLNKLFE